VRFHDPTGTDGAAADGAAPREAIGVA
jgi:hypothetical protein